ncbi:FtsX-like permease family protein [Paramicrobacterium agarici]|uniref:FtsX-like permease family protein n=1 Tax=Paramicrobacterium agarici TaxID=630514 RepID=UPI0011710C33|nr:FtsX-like permease family protein [Microbacterium agarici]TQO23353.1 FtsX-like permease family protein [Microbacterium agarici]
MSTALDPQPPTAARRRMPVVRLTWMLSRPGAQSAAALVLPAIAFAVTTALLLIVMGGTLMFWSWRNETAGLYQMLSVLALALLVVPLISLGGAAARLSARRRDDRLATLRLLGATPWSVQRMTVLESTAVAVLGALVGVALYVMTMPLVGLIPFGGGPIGAAAIWVGTPVILAIVAGVALVAALSSVIGLRQVTISPLGVRTRQQPQSVHWVRVLVGLAAVVVAFTVLQNLGVLGSWALIVIVLGGAFAAGVAVINLIGPWALSVFAKVQLRSATSAQKLIAARGILDNPKAAWRQVSGVAMTSFVAVVGGSGTALANVASSGARPEDVTLLMDIRTGILITLIASFLMVACSVGVNQAAEILDRRETWVNLDRVGMPRSVMERTRSRHVMAPLTFVALLSALLGGVMVFPLIGISMILAPVSLLVIVLCFVGGFALVAAALVATRAVMTRVLSQPERV